MRRREFIAATSGLLAIPALARAGAAPAAQEASTPSFKLAYGPHPGLFAAHAGDAVPEQIAFAAGHGFRGFEDNGMRGRSREDQDAIAAALDRHGVAMGVFVAHSIDWQTPTLTTGDAAARERFVNEVKESVELAKRLNTKACTVVPGVEARNLPVGVQTANVVEALKRAAGVCEASGLVLVCEPLNWRDHPGLFLRYSDQAYAIMKAVASPSCKILFDVYHQQATEGNLLENIDRCWDEIAYFQVGDNPGRREPGTGEINYRAIFRRLWAGGYRGVVGMEHGKSGAGVEGELALIAAYRHGDAF
jgi:hydroxypyruvate isomerase